MSRPTLDATVAALRCTDPRFSWIGPTSEEAEVADLLEELAGIHTPTQDEADNPTDHRIVRTYGTCTGCGEVWPCTGWVYAEQLGVQWLGRGMDRYLADAWPAVDRLNRGGAA